jgi:2-polyprenyl-3-methyl-5-hydroxy-6-metoxy-1,4-benzoquinol methylase
MKILDIHNNSLKPKLYEKGNAIMWTDEHISKQLLNVHLNKEVDLGSRKTTTIDSTIDWISDKVDNKQLNILDLGCGPGLYAEKLAEKGHKVTGIDFSANSISYAKKEAKNKNLEINYLNKDYLMLDLEENSFDLVILICTDFGPLLPKERVQLLDMIRRALKPGGTFIFDVLNDKNIDTKTSPRNWETSTDGFWKNKPYLALSDSFVYQENKVILYQHIVIDEKGEMKVYRFWTHFFSNQDLAKILNENKFSNLAFHADVLPKGDLWNGDNVTFCIAKNNR